MEINLSFISDEIRELAQYMLDNPENWHQCDYWFTHTGKPSMRIWTRNGVMFINLNGNSCLNFFEKRHLYKTIKKANAKKVTNTINAFRNETKV